MAQASWQAQPRRGTLKSVFPTHHARRRKFRRQAPTAMKRAASNYLSKKEIPARERLIVALDVSSREKAERIVEKLGDTVVFYKLGWELLLTPDYFPLIDSLHKKGKLVLADIKIFDIPETVGHAVKQLKKHHVRFVTVHGNDEILRAAVALKNGTKVLAVTVLTSLDRADIRSLGFKCSVQELVESRARRALQLKCDGVISSGREAKSLRRTLGDRFFIVTPGIRPVANTDDQKRTVNVEKAFKNGADYIVVGRPILKKKNQKAAAEAIQATISKLFPPKP